MRQRGTLRASQGGIPLTAPEQPASEAAVAAPSAPRRQRRRLMLVGVPVAILVIAGVAFGVSQLLQPPPPTGPVESAGFLPQDTLIYLDLDLEPDGAQGAALNALSERLAVLGPQAGAGRLIDPLFEGVTGGRYSYSRDVAPWSDGHVTLAILDWGGLGIPVNPFNPLPGNPAAPGAVLLLGVDDGDGARALTDRLRADAATSGMSFASTRSGDWTIWAAAAGDGQQPIAYALGPGLLVAGLRVADVERIVDLHDKGGETLLADEGFRREIGRLPAERVATIFARRGALPAGLGIGGLLPGAPTSTSDFLTSFLPIEQVGGIVLAENSVVLERWQAPPRFVEQPAERRNDDLARRLPSATLGYVELPEFGRTLNGLLGAIRSDAVVFGGQEGQRTVTGIEAVLGSRLGDAAGWIGDTGVAFAAGNGPTFGLVAETNDADAAAARLNGLTTLLQTAGIGQVRSEELGGAHLVTADVPFLFGSTRLEYTLVDGHLLVGLEGFVRGLLTEPGSAGFGDDATYRDALAHSQAEQNAGVSYFSFDAFLERMRSDPLLGNFSVTAPLLAPLRDVTWATFVEGDLIRSRLELRLD